MIIRTYNIGGTQVLETALTSNLLTETATLIDTGIRQAIAGIGSDKRRIEMVATRLLVKHHFGNKATLSHLTSGVPVVTIADKPVSTHISLSHCKGKAVLALSDNTPIGIDVECIADRIQRLAHRVLNEDELHCVGTSTLLATIAWTAKEALFKCIPEEGVDFRERLHIDMSNLTDDVTTAEYTAQAYGRTYRLSTIVDRPFVMTLARKAE